MTPFARLALCALGGATLACDNLDRFDTTESDDAFCGSIVSAQFVRTTEPEGGFQRELRARLTIDTDFLTSTPATLTTDDGEDGPCAPAPTFDGAVVRVTPEVVHDPLSTMTFSDAQEHNVLGWVSSTCRGPMLTIISLLRNDDVELRLLKPAEASEIRSAFALFKLQRRQSDCGF